jgi:hypothetical protein
LRDLRLNFRGWQLQRASGQGVRVRFADQSEVLCTPTKTSVIIPGHEAQSFLQFASPGGTATSLETEAPTPDI